MESGPCGGMFNGGNKFSWEFLFLAEISPVEGRGRILFSLPLKDWLISLNEHCNSWV